VIDLQTLANLAEIAGGIAIISGGVFAVVQLREFREQRRQAVAVELVRTFSEIEHANAVNLIQQLPDAVSRGAAAREGPRLRARGDDDGGDLRDDRPARVPRMASFALVQELAGGLTVVLWRKLPPGSSRSARSRATLVRRVVPVARRAAARESCTRRGHPAHERYADWRPRE
jgi:hypothetical protein